MPFYAVFIDASNFLVEIDGVMDKHGFFVTRVVEAADPNAAELQAVQSLRDDGELRALVRNSKDDPPVMDVKEIREADSLPEVQTGRAWYRMEPKRWWQFWKR
jgi:hypothetical protein